ncbi:MAG TPA: methionyl-tRNA formyltransferase [Bacteroidales bacterium]|nr:MAG: Methionyl-tRNA formyltransferase [Bacteroidetes bacterium ADurb.Bin217]HPM12397.1 methionyl-tRNA formyltransferase [Bacteroidales bacterium]
MRILYMGTPEFAVAPLQNLINQNYTIVGVVTAPDKPAGRGQQISMSAVKTCALQHNLSIFQPTNLKSEEFITQVRTLQPDIILVIAFRMLPKVIWEIPPLGTINIHGSLLPQYRGAAPIHWAVVNGETQTGVTSFYINETIDTGNIILQKTIDIAHTDTTGLVYERLMNLAAELSVETIKYVQKHPHTSTPQESITCVVLHHAPKIEKETCKINWNACGTNIYNHIRGFSPFPAAWTLLKKQDKTIICKIYFALFTPASHDYIIGTILTDQTNISIAVKDGFIQPTDIQLEGKKRMSIQECMRGFSFTDVQIEI